MLTKRHIPYRYVLTVLGFIGFVFNYMLRVNINLIITSMVRDKDSTENQSDLFDWDSKVRNDVISTFFYGYMLLQLPGGRLAEKIGGKRVIAAALGLTACLTLLIPEAAKLGGKEKDDYPYYLVAVRVLMGLCEGCTYPAVTSMLVKWAPPTEKSVMSTFIMAGAQVGTILGFFVSGLLVSCVGWEITFYIEGGVTFLWLALWLLFVFDSPAGHPYISQSELDYLTSSIPPAVEKTCPPIPWRCMLTSLPFWAIVVANFSNNWGFHLLMTELPQYLTEVFPEYMEDSTTAGLWTAVPYACMWVSGITFSVISDLIVRRRMVPVSFARKVFNTLSQAGPAVCLAIMLISVSNENKMLTLTLTLFTFAVAMEGGLYSGFLVNPQDIAPNFAGTILGITNGFGNIPGFVAPKIAGILVNEDPSNLDNWTPVWITACVILAIGSTFFVIFADGSAQSWNSTTSTEQKPSTHNTQSSSPSQQHS